MCATSNTFTFKRMQVRTVEASGIIYRRAGRTNGKSKISNTLHSERERCEVCWSTRRHFRRRGKITEEMTIGVWRCGESRKGGVEAQEENQTVQQEWSGIIWGVRFVGQGACGPGEPDCKSGIVLTSFHFAAVDKVAQIIWVTIQGIVRGLELGNMKTNDVAMWWCMMWRDVVEGQWGIRVQHFLQIRSSWAFC